MRRHHDAIDARTLAICVTSGLFLYSAWLSSIVYCAANGLRPLLIISALCVPVGVVKGIAVWFGL